MDCSHYYIRMNIGIYDIQKMLQLFSVILSTYPNVYPYKKMTKQVHIIKKLDQNIHTLQCFNLQNSYMFRSSLAHRQGTQLYKTMTRPCNNLQ